MSSETLPGFPLNRSQQVMLCAAALGVIIGFAVGRSVEPDPRGYGTHQQFGLPPCTFQTVFGIPCPSCGGTTSVALFTRGEWMKSFLANPAVFTGSLMAVLFVPWAGISSWKRRLLGVSKPSLTCLLLMSAVCAIALGQWAVRLLA